MVALHAALGRKAVDRQRLRVVQVDEFLHRPQCVGGLLLRLRGARLRAAAAFDQLRDDEGRQTAQVRLVAPPVKFLLKQAQEAAQPLRHRKHRPELRAVEALFTQALHHKIRRDLEADVRNVALLQRLPVAHAALHGVDHAGAAKIDVRPLQDNGHGRQRQQEFIGRVAVRERRDDLIGRAPQLCHGQNAAVAVIAQLRQIPALRAVGLKQWIHSPASSRCGSWRPNRNCRNVCSLPSRQRAKFDRCAQSMAGKISASAIVPRQSLVRSR